MVAPASRVYDVAKALLDATISYHGGALPDRQYVSAGAPAWDCELVAVWCESTGSVEGGAELDAFESQRRLAGHTMRAGTFVVTIVRCTPAVPEMVGQQIKQTSVDEENAAAVDLYQDAQMIINAIREAEEAGELGTCNSVVFDTWVPIGPDGGFVGGEQRVRVGLSTGF